MIEKILKDIRGLFKVQDKAIFFLIILEAIPAVM